MILKLLSAGRGIWVQMHAKTDRHIFTTCFQYTLDGAEDTIRTHDSSNRRIKIHVDFFQWLSIRIVKSGLYGKDAYTVLVKEMSWNWMTQEKVEKY